MSQTNLFIVCEFLIFKYKNFGVKARLDYRQDVGIIFGSITDFQCGLRYTI